MLKVATVSPNEPYREYKDVERVYSGSTEIDKILDKNGNVLFAVSKEVEGTPPLTYKGKEDTNLKNYRIYGQTVDGESVGDRAGNLFDGVIEQGTISADGTLRDVSNRVRTKNFTVLDAGTYTIQSSNNVGEISVFIFTYTDDGTFIERLPSDWIALPYSFTLSERAKVKIVFEYAQGKVTNPSDVKNIMLNTGSTPLPYEPYGYKVPVTVEGKNLLPNTATSQTKNGVTFTVNGDGSIFCNGQASPNNADLVNPDFLLPSGTYILTGCPDGGSDRETYKILIYVNGAWCANDRGSGANFTLTKTSTVSVRIAVYAGYTCDNLTFYPMIRRADITDDTYEPYHAPVTIPIYFPEQIKMVGDETEYVDYGEQKQHRVRKNLLQNTATSQTINGVTFTVNSDGSLTCNGTARATGYIKLNDNLTIEAGEYIVTANNTELFNHWYIDVTNLSNELLYRITSDSDAISFNSDINARVWFNIQNGYTCDNLTFYPMVRKADIEDDTYEPYIEDTELDVTLPALPTLSGTNTLTVGTEVQPSNVYLKGRIKEIA